MNTPKISRLAIALSTLVLSFASLSAVADQSGANLPPPPPAYAQPTQNGNPYAQSGQRNYGPYPNMNRYGNYAPRNFNANNFNPRGFNPSQGMNRFPGNFNTPNFGQQNFNGPRMNSNNYPMPWNNRGNNGTPFMSSQNLPMMDSKEWAQKVPDWGAKNGPYKAGPWANTSNKNQMEDWWDDMINAPHDMGRMPGGWKAPSFSMPNPVDVTDQLGKQFDKLPGQVREMNVSN